MPNSTTVETTRSFGAVPHELMADEVIEISDDMLMEMGPEDDASETAPPPLPASSS